MPLRRRSQPTSPPTEPVTIRGGRVVLRPLAASDFEQWREVRRRCADWLTDTWDGTETSRCT